MKRPYYRKLNAAGDTIVEVLIAMAVVSLVLASAFVVVSRTLRNAQQAREHTEALQLLQGQLEQAKALAKTPGNQIFTGSTVFCISSTGTFVAIGGSTLPAASYPAQCSVGAVAGGYKVGIVRGANNVFTAKANWQGPTGAQDEVSLIYRLYP
jgi:type II secretory pathway pseudopilin PulG